MLKWHRKYLFHHQLSHSLSLAVTPMETMPAVDLLVVTRKGPLLPDLHSNSLQARLLVRDLALNAVALVHVRRTVSRTGLALRLTDLSRPHLNRPLRKWAAVVVPVVIVEWLPPAEVLWVWLLLLHFLLPHPPPLPPLQTLSHSLLPRSVCLCVGVGVADWSQTACATFIFFLHVPPSLPPSLQATTSLSYHWPPHTIPCTHFHCIYIHRQWHYILELPFYYFLRLFSVVQPEYLDFPTPLFSFIRCVCVYLCNAACVMAFFVLI